MAVASGIADDVIVVIEVNAVPEHSVVEEQAVAKEVTPLPVIKAVPLQSWKVF